MRDLEERYRIKIQHILREYRLNAKLRQVDLAKLLNRPQSYVSKLESGDKMLNIIELLNFCQALNIKLSDVAKTIEVACEGK